MFQENNQTDPYSNREQGIVTAKDWVWVSGDEIRELEHPDSEGVLPEDFRIKEVNQTISELLDKNQKIVFVKANSGFGISKFFLPRLEKALASKNLEMYHAEILTESDAQYADEYGDVIVIDELGQSSGGFEGGIAILADILVRNPKLKVVVVFDDTKHPKISTRLQEMQKSNLLGRVEMNPKLLSISQATDFAMHGKPFNRTGSQGTLFEGLSLVQSTAIIEAFAKKFPLHFRLIDILRWSGNNYDWDTEREITFEERLHMVESDELDYKFEEKMAWDPMGLQDRGSINT